MKATKVNELKDLLKKAQKLLYCPNYGRTATRPCLCEGCTIREEIQKVLKGVE